MSSSKVKQFVGVVRVLAGLLAGAVLVFELLAANSGFHQALHQTGKAASNNCVICLFAKGQVESSPSEPAFAAFVGPSPALPRVEFTTWVDFTYLLAQSRAPPALDSLLSVVA